MSDVVFAVSMLIVFNLMAIYAIHINNDWSKHCERLNDEWAEYCDKLNSEWSEYCKKIIEEEKND